jgi:hypothetical protein
MMPATRPPLWVYVAALLLAACVLVMVVVLDGFYWRTGLNLGRLQAEAGSRQVVVVGTSKTRLGIDYDARLLAHRPGAASAFSFHRVTRSSATLDSLEPAFDVLHKNPPRLLLIESDLLLLDRHDASGAGLQELRLAMRQLPARMLELARGAATWDGNDGNDVHEQASQCAIHTSAAGLYAYAATARRWQVASRRETSAFLSHIRALQQAGTEVVLLDIPRSAAADTVFPAALATAVAAQRADLQRQQGLSFWTPDSVIADNEYCDQGHMTSAGQRRYSDWLARRLHQWRESVHD